MRSTIKMEIPNVRDGDVETDIYEGWLGHVCETGDADKGEVREMAKELLHLRQLLCEALDIIHEHVDYNVSTIWVVKARTTLAMGGD